MYIIDRIENKTAIVCDENGNKIEIDVSIINGSLKDGSVIYKKDDVWIVDEPETEKELMT